MRLDIRDNIKEVTKWTTDAQKKQIPFATAMAINKTLGIGKGNRMKGLDRTMQKQMNQKLDRPMARTTKAFYRIPAKKMSLTGTLGFVDWANNFMIYQVEGGVRSTGKNIPVPFVPNARLNKFGNITGKRTGLIKKKNQFFGSFGKAEGVFERQRDNSVKLITAFEQSVTYEPKLPFYKIARKYSNAVIDKNFAFAFDKALRTAK